MRWRNASNRSDADTAGARLGGVLEVGSVQFAQKSASARKSASWASILRFAALCLASACCPVHVTVRGLASCPPRVLSAESLAELLPGKSSPPASGAVSIRGGLAGCRLAALTGRRASESRMKHCLAPAAADSGAGQRLAMTVARATHWAMPRTLSA